MALRMVSSRPRFGNVNMYVGGSRFAFACMGTNVLKLSGVGPHVVEALFSLFFFFCIFA